jgi:hypothetical protein
LIFGEKYGTGYIVKIEVILNEKALSAERKSLLIGSLLGYID